MASDHPPEPKGPGLRLNLKNPAARIVESDAEAPCAQQETDTLEKEAMLAAAGFANPIDAWKKAEADALRIALGGHATPEDALKAEIAKWKDRQAKEVTDTLKGISGRAYGIPHSAVDALTGSLSSAVADRSIQSAAEDALKDIAGLAKAAPRFGTGKAGSSALGDEIPVPVSLPSWLVQQQFAPAAQQPAKLQPTPVSAEEARAFNELLSVLAKGEANPQNREIMADVIAKYCADTKGKQLVLPLPQVAKAAHPDDEAAAQRFLSAMQEAVQSGQLPRVWSEGVRIGFSHLAAWPECPGVAENSPLRYWLKHLPVVAPKVEAAEGGASNDEQWHSWCEQRKAANTKPDGTPKVGRGRSTWTADDLRFLGLRHSTLVGRFGSSSAAKTAIAADLGVSTQALIEPLKKLANLQAESSNQPIRKVI